MARLRFVSILWTDPFLSPVRWANWAADSPLFSNWARMTRRWSLEVRTRPLVSIVTGNFGIAAAVVTEAKSEPLVDIIALRTMIPVGL